MIDPQARQLKLAGSNFADSQKILYQDPVFRAVCLAGLFTETRFVIIASGEVAGSSVYSLLVFGDFKDAVV